MSDAAFKCPLCGFTSHNPNDARERYCAHCHVFVDDEVICDHGGEGPMSDQPVKFAADNVVYLGDGAYVSTDGVDVWIETSNGVEITNSVCLDQAAIKALLQYIREEYGTM